MDTVGDYLGLRLDGLGPLYRQLYRSVRSAILEGRLGEGSRLPATRALAQGLGLSRNSVLQAFEQLTAEGYLVGHTGAGTFVASPLPEAMLPAHESDFDTPSTKQAEPRWSRVGRRLAASPAAGPEPPPWPRYDFRYGRIDADVRLQTEWRRLLHRAAANYPTEYGDPAGHPNLRAAIADYVRRSRGCRCDAGQIVVVNGSQQALDLIARLLLDPDDTVAIEEPGYRGAVHAFTNADARLHPTAVDEEGLIVDALPSAARLAYVTASHQFPTGAVLSLRRRLALLAWAERTDAWIVEDDYDSEFRYEGRPVEAVQGLDRTGRTLYVGTFSKILFPAARLGYIIVPPAMRDAFVNAKWWSDRHTPILEQLTLARFIAGGDFERHLQRMRKRYAERRAALLAALDCQFGDSVKVTGTRAGLHLVATFAGLDGAGLSRLLIAARERDVGLYSADRLYMSAPPGNSLLMGYASLTPEEIQEGIARLTGLPPPTPTRSPR